MGVFSGLLNGILGGSGGIGDLASKAMNIGSKLINRKEGQSFGDALVGQLPAIASGLGGVAKNFGGFIPGIGGIVSKIGGMVEEGAKEFENNDDDMKDRVEEVDVNDDNYINSPHQLLKHASNNMPVMGGLANVHRLGEPARMDRQDMDFPTESRGQSSSNWRSFRPSQMDKIDSLQDMEANNMYAANLPKTAYNNSTKPQTIEDVQPVSFKKNFIR